MADNTLQFQWIVTIKENLEALFRDQADVFVAGDNLIYPVKGDNTVRLAPDVYVAFGRPKGHRGSYRVWEEGGIFPQVIFEVLSAGNRLGEMKKKRQFFRRHGAEEYYVFDPEDNTLEGWLRQGRKLEEIDDTNGYKSPRLGIRFDTSGAELLIYRPDGERFLTFQELRDSRDAERQRAEAAERELDRTRAMLRAAGIDPDKPPPG
jgi:Uma2 family endonuclease